jgi:hypothetical protein
MAAPRASSFVRSSSAQLAGIHPMGQALCRPLNCCYPSSSLPPSLPAFQVQGCSTLLHKPLPMDVALGGFLQSEFDNNIKPLLVSIDLSKSF